MMKLELSVDLKRGNYCFNEVKSKMVKIKSLGINKFDFFSFSDRDYKLSGIN